MLEVVEYTSDYKQIPFLSPSLESPMAAAAIKKIISFMNQDSAIFKLKCFFCRIGKMKVITWIIKARPWGHQRLKLY